MWSHVLTAAVAAAVGRASKCRGEAGPGLPRQRGADAEGDRDADDLARRARVESVLTADEVSIALQPLVSLVDGRVEGVEALARFADGRGPDQWFGDAQAVGLGRALDSRTFAAALRVLTELPDDVYLSVNAGPDLLIDLDFQRRLTGSGLPLHRLVVEITEHAQVADYGALKDAVAGLREHDVRVAIDDTGAGYASFNHVLQLRPDVIKLDRGLVTDLDRDPARRSLVTALVLLALEIGASVTGEGVETEEQLEALATLGVDQAQGYLLARPTLDRTDWRGWWGRHLAGPASAAG
jgi:EAL domain-containing protein (putative c-di-GMP-specific phosphodiesterase class I)